MPWKAWLDGHEFDLETLRDLFRSGDQVVEHDPSDEYYLESSELEDSDGQIDQNAADVLVKRINGVGRVADQGFRPVHLRGRYTAPDGTTSVVAFAETAEAHSRLSAVAVVMKDGSPVPEPPPKGPRYVKLAEHVPDVADVLRVLGQPGVIGLVRHIQGMGDCGACSRRLAAGSSTRLGYEGGNRPAHRLG